MFTALKITLVILIISAIATIIASIEDDSVSDATASHLKGELSINALYKIQDEKLYYLIFIFIATFMVLVSITGIIITIKHFWS